jgi:hypothetical protein
MAGGDIINPAEDLASIGPTKFYLGTHRPNWLWREDIDFPLCVSYRTIAEIVTPRPATCGWMLDSGAYTQLRDHGRWTLEPIRYVQEVDRLDREVGRLEWAASQDYMCEPWVIHGGWHDDHYYAGTRQFIDPDHTMTDDELVAEHQRRTVDNFLECCRWWPEFSDEANPIMPSVQGWTIPQYLRCEQMYKDAGVDLSEYPVVGLGSVCRRQGTAEITALAEILTPRIALHGFGVKTRGLLATNRFTSADSLAWSYEAAKTDPLPGHQHKHCNNCPVYARRWRDRLMAALGEVDCGTWQECLPIPWDLAA